MFGIVWYTVKVRTSYRAYLDRVSFDTGIEHTQNFLSYTHLV